MNTLSYQRLPDVRSPAVLSDTRIACSNCSLANICLPVGLPSNDRERLDHLIQHRPTIQRGGFLYQANSPFTSLYAIRRGFFKTLVLTRDGREQITGFHMPGDIMGINAISSNQHPCFAVALEDSEVCEIPFTRLESLTRELPTLQRHLHCIMSREVVHDQGMMMILGNMSAEERLAAFLMYLSMRYQVRGYARNRFHLAMTRGEIGNFLGMKLETVSRTFSKLHTRELIRVNKKQVELLDIDALKQLANDPHTRQLV